MSKDTPKNIYEHTKQYCTKNQEDIQEFVPKKTEPVTENVLFDGTDDDERAVRVMELRRRAEEGEELFKQGERFIPQTWEEGGR